MILVSMNDHVQKFMSFNIIVNDIKISTGALVETMMLVSMSDHV